MVFQRDDSSMRWNNTDSGRCLSGSYVPVTGGIWTVGCLVASSFLQWLEVLGCWEACWWEDSSTRWRFLDCEVLGCVRFSPVTGGIGMLVWISDLGMKKGFPEITGNPVCGAKGIRTPDPLHAMEMRYQLRHSPVELAGFEPATLCLQSRCATSCAIAP